MEHACRRAWLARWIVGALLAGMATAPAHAAEGPLIDKIADAITIVVLVFVPVAGVVVFWMLHVLPEKIAHKRHHPQIEAISTLCLLSLVFGGLLWPLAWLWAYTKPVGYRLAYGTDKGIGYYREMAERLHEGALAPEQVHHLHEDLAAMQSRGALTPELRALMRALADPTHGNPGRATTAVATQAGRVDRAGPAAAQEGV